MTETPRLALIVEQDSSGAFTLWACRGEARGCAQNRGCAAKRHCEDCVLARDHETLGELMDRAQRGDA